MLLIDAKNVPVIVHQHDPIHSAQQLSGFLGVAFGLWHSYAIGHLAHLALAEKIPPCPQSYDFFPDCTRNVSTFFSVAFFAVSGG